MSFCVDDAAAAAEAFLSQNPSSSNVHQSLSGSAKSNGDNDCSDSSSLCVFDASSVATFYLTKNPLSSAPQSSRTPSFECDDESQCSSVNLTDAAAAATSYLSLKHSLLDKNSIRRPSKPHSDDGNSNSSVQIIDAAIAAAVYLSKNTSAPALAHQSIGIVLKGDGDNDNSDSQIDGVAELSQRIYSLPVRQRISRILETSRVGESSNSSFYEASNGDDDVSESSVIAIDAATATTAFLKNPDRLSLITDPTKFTLLVPNGPYTVEHFKTVPDDWLDIL